MKKNRDGKENHDPEGLWRKVASTVRAYDEKAAQPRGKKASASPPRARETPPSGSSKPSALDDATRRKLLRGRIEIEARIDLHGMTQDEARGALSRFIARARARDLRTVLVITGKGRAPGSGVLKRMLPLWLEDMPGVLSLAPAGPKDGGDGAFYVRLRKS
jgi:DNA-nicking Smr family endonuclease